jgi:hypothetical protein
MITNLEKSLADLINLTPIFGAIGLAILIRWQFHRKDVNLIKESAERAGVKVIRVARVRWSHLEYSELNPVFAQSRGGGLYYHVTVKEGDVCSKQLWKSEGGVLSRMT